MSVKFDFHIHTRYSDGLCSHPEIVSAAEAKGLEAMAFTDHGPELSVGVSLGRLNQMLEDIKLAREGADIHILAGIESNVIDQYGMLDVDEGFIKNLDFLAVGVHNMETDVGADFAHEYLQRVTRAIERQEIDILAHPFHFNTDLLLGLSHEDVEEFVDLAAEHDVAMELNTKYKAPSDDFIKICLKKGVKLSVGSDAHRLAEVGRIDWALATLKRVGATREDLIFDAILR
jgi:putative hydrolase